jgi:hypothetical protein
MTTENHSLAERQFALFTGAYSKVLHSLAIPHAVTGSAAVQAYVLAAMNKKYGPLSSFPDSARVERCVRPTKSVDILFDGRHKGSEDLIHVPASMEFRYDGRGSRGFGCLVERRGSTRMGFKVVLDGAEDRTAYVEMLDYQKAETPGMNTGRALYNAVDVTIAFDDTLRVTIPVVPTRNLLASKVSLLQRGKPKHGVDVYCLLEVMNCLGEKVDVPALRKTILGDTRFPDGCDDPRFGILEGLMQGVAIQG